MRTKAIFIMSTICALALVTVVPAAAIPETPVSVTLTGGTLSITVPTGSVNLGHRVNTVAEGTISGSLGEVQVLDARSAAAGSGWVASVISTALTPPSGPTIGAAEIGYTVGTITKVGTATYTANDPLALTGTVAAVTATGITGDNSATWNPTINVTVAGGMVANVYTGTITHSVV
jgi:hypothetical protein